MTVVALVPAAGRGERLGVATPKAMVRVAGHTLVRRAVTGLLDTGHVDHVVVAAPDDWCAKMHADLTCFGAAVTVIAGGGARSDSVRLALAAARHLRPEVVLVHDAARAFVPRSVIDAVIKSVLDGAPAVIPVLPVIDTIKTVDEYGDITSTVDRSTLRTVQTPQGFASDVLRRAHELSTDGVTDDARLVELLGERVHTVPGHPHAMKITTAFDLQVAEAILAR
ncbi:MAG: 2-C-methyl-D-erythritol 4-phosphate cytidylyltransferase [Sciscionella sp.]